MYGFRLHLYKYASARPRVYLPLSLSGDLVFQHADLSHRSSRLPRPLRISLYRLRFS